MRGEFQFSFGSFVSRDDWPHFKIIQLFLCHSLGYRARNDLESDMEFRCVSHFTSF